jgi:hypothetical protein
MTRDKQLAPSDSVDAFLEKLKSVPPAGAAGRGRLIFGMDATMSRQPAWDRALSIQADMFNETARIGGLDVQLVYFRGIRECRASKWVSNPEALSRLMTGIACEGGYTQIGKLLGHIAKEAGAARVSAAVFVGDAMEESIEEITIRAGEIGLLGVPVFVFQDGNDPTAEAAFHQIARLTRGAYCRLGAGSAAELRALLSAVAVYASGGMKALVDHATAKGGAAAKLIGQMR